MLISHQQSSTDEENDDGRENETKNKACSIYSD